MWHREETPAETPGHQGVSTDRYSTTGISVCSPLEMAAVWTPRLVKGVGEATQAQRLWAASTR